MSEPQSDVSPKKTGAPPWATEPFKRFVNQTERLDQVVHLSMRGISGLRGVPGLVKALAKVEDEHSEKAKQRLEDADRTAELAKREVETGFPVLHSQAVVNLWSLLEALIHDFLCAWLLNTPDALFVDAIRKLRVRLGEYEQLEKKDRISYIVELLEKELVIGVKYGVPRFEMMLAPFKLGGTVSSALRRDILELGQVRNIIVHRGGIADQQFASTCPWMKLESGDELKVTHKMLSRYFHSVHDYAVILICRVGEHHGVDMSHVKSKKRKTKDDLHNHAHGRPGASE